MKISCAAYLYMLCFGVSCGFSRIARIEVYEGDNCKLKTSANGICKKFNECEPLMNDIAHGRNYDDRVKCTGDEDEDIEIVCCPQTISTNNAITRHTSTIGSKTGDERGTVKVSSAEQACQQFTSRIQSSVETLNYHISGGIEAEEGEFPYMAALGYLKTDAITGNITEYTCGGTLISPRYVLTAAHCVSNFEERVPYQVRMGTINIKLTSQTLQDIRIKQPPIVHPKYRRSQGLFDVALLELEKPVEWTRHVQPICLQTQALKDLKPVLNGSFIVAGWGAISSNSFEQSDKLLRTPPQDLVSIGECESHYAKTSFFPDGLGNHTLCARDSNKTRRSDACHGDSGGPLLQIVDSKDAMPTIVGITSFGQFCSSSAPSGYMSVYSFIDWIEEIITFD